MDATPEHELRGALRKEAKLKRKKFLLLIAAICILAALIMLLYPPVSAHFNRKYQSAVYTEHIRQTQELDVDIQGQTRDRASAYNRAIKSGGNTFTADSLRKAMRSYDEQLDINGDGMMGGVEIPKIGVKLPIYHGTGDATLTHGAGHLLGSSLPVGGPGTHTILTAHSGMAGDRMFSDLPDLEEGDIFYLHVLGDKLAYQVDEITVSAPEDTSHLTIAEGEDRCTLVTCTPFGVNTHRLLVRGTRITEEEAEVQEQKMDRRAVLSVWMGQYIKGVSIATGAVAVLIGGYFLMRHRRKKGEK